MEGAPGPRAVWKASWRSPVAREGGTGASGRKWEALPGCLTPHFKDTKEEGEPPVQALIQGLETLCPGRNTSSLFRGVSSTKAGLSAGFSLLGVLHLLLIWPPPVPIRSTSDYLPTSQVGPQGKSQAQGPFLIRSALPFPCYLPAIPRSQGFQPGPLNPLVSYSSPSLPLQSTSLERLSPKFCPPVKTAQVKCHLLCEGLPGLPGGLNPPSLHPCPHLRPFLPVKYTAWVWSPDAA